MAALTEYDVNLKSSGYGDLQQCPIPKAVHTAGSLDYAGMKGNHIICRYPDHSAILR